MSANAMKRISRDLKKIMNENDESILIDYDESDLFHVTAMIKGPAGTPWDGGFFQLKITYSEQYPIKVPEVVFVTEMFHPNIYPDGRICLDLLNTQWSSVYDTWAILISIRTLLANPNLQSPAHDQACKIYMNNKIDYERRVKQIVMKTMEQ